MGHQVFRPEAQTFPGDAIGKDLAGIERGELVHLGGHGVKGARAGKAVEALRRAGGGIAHPGIVAAQ
jgi:hypothetical protein